MAGYLVDATDPTTPQPGDTAGPFISDELRAIKTYYLNKISSLTASVQSILVANTEFVNKLGDTMLGQLLVPAVPNNTLSAVPKTYVDTAIASLLASLSGASLSATMFVGLRMGADFHLLVDYGAGNWDTSQYLTYGFFPINSTFSIDNAGHLIVTY